jgi:hypothetical protein
VRVEARGLKLVEIIGQKDVEIFSTALTDDIDHNLEVQELLTLTVDQMQDKWVRASSPPKCCVFETHAN